MTESTNITLEQFIQQNNIRFECKRVNSRPDGFMDEPSGTGNAINNQGTRHFKCRISSGALAMNGFNLYFSQGSAHTADPTAAEVLDCLASGAASVENAGSFEDWAEELGFETDSRKAEKAYKAIKRQAEQLQRIMDSDAYQTLLWNTERL